MLLNEEFKKPAIKESFVLPWYSGFISKDYYDVGGQGKENPGVASREQLLLASNTLQPHPCRPRHKATLPESLCCQTHKQDRDDGNTATRKETHIRSGRSKQTVKEQRKRQGERHREQALSAPGKSSGESRLENTDEEASRRRVQGQPTPNPANEGILKACSPEPDNHSCLNLRQGNEAGFDLPKTITEKPGLAVPEATAEGAVVPFF